MDKTQKRLILFMPSMDGGGVEKNIVLISNYLSKHLNNIYLITFDKKFNNKFSKKIHILNVKNTRNNFKYSKYYKYFRCLFLLIKELILMTLMKLISKS